jgi:hypothetical protein
MALIEWSTTGFELTPAGTDPGSVIDDRIQELKEQIRRRAHQGGHLWTVASPNHTRDGRHAVDADGGGTEPDVYKSDQTTVLLKYEDTSIWGKESIYGAMTSLHVPIAATATGRVEGLIVYNLGEGKLKLLEAELMAWNAPVSTALTVDIHRLTSIGASTDPAATGNPPDEGSIWNTIPSLAATNFFAGPFSDFHTVLTDPQYLAEGEAWVFEIDLLSSAYDIAMILKVVREPA